MANLIVAARSGTEPWVFDQGYPMFSCMTADDGGFSIAIPKGWQRAVLRVLPLRWKRAGVVVNAEDFDDPVDLRVELPARTVGRVLWHDGMPVEDVLVRSVDQPVDSGKTDNLGCFELPGAQPVVGNYRLEFFGGQISQVHRLRSQWWIDASLRVLPVEVVRDGVCQISVTPAGVPYAVVTAEGQTFEIARSPQGGPLSLPIPLDRTGSAVIRAVPLEGPYLPSAPVAVLDSPGNRAANLELRQARFLQIKVLDAENYPQGMACVIGGRWSGLVRDGTATVKVPAELDEDVVLVRPASGLGIVYRRVHRLTDSFAVRIQEPASLRVSGLEDSDWMLKLVDASLDRVPEEQWWPWATRARGRLDGTAVLGPIPPGRYGLQLLAKSSPVVIAGGGRIVDLEAGEVMDYHVDPADFGAGRLAWDSLDVPSQTSSGVWIFDQKTADARKWTFVEHVTQGEGVFVAASSELYLAAHQRDRHGRVILHTARVSVAGDGGFRWKKKWAAATSRLRIRNADDSPFVGSVVIVSEDNPSVPHRNATDSSGLVPIVGMVGSIKLIVNEQEWTVDMPATGLVTSRVD